MTFPDDAGIDSACNGKGKAWAQDNKAERISGEEAAVPLPVASKAKAEFQQTPARRAYDQSKMSLH